MKKKAFSKIFASALIAVVIAAVLAGCGKDNAPKFGERVKDYDGFKTLKEEHVVVKDKLTLQVFVPNGSVSKSKFGGLTASNNGITLSVRMVEPNTIRSVGGMKKYIEKTGLTTLSNIFAVEEKFNDVVKKDDMAYASKYTISKSIGKYSAASKTEFIKKLEFEGKTYYAYGSIDVNEPALNDDSEKMLEEMKDYYGVDIYHDKDKLKERIEYFTKNPAKYKRVIAGRYLIPIPESWDSDKSVSNTQIKVYGPNGKATEKENIFIGSQYMSSSVANLAEGSLETYMKNYMEKIFKDLKLSIKPTKASLEGTKAFTVVMKKGNGEFKGYLIIDRNQMIFVYAAGKGKVGSKANDIVENSFKNMTYLRKTDAEINS